MEAMQMRMKMPDCWFLLFMISLSVLISGSAGTDSLMDECAEDLTKVTACLAFVTGKGESPTKDCCNAVTDIKQDKPVCLCYFIQQTHNGSAQAKSLGIQEPKLLQLPSACKLANLTISDCPKLLNITSSSPDYSIFTSNSSTSTAPSAGTSSSSSPTNTATGNNADKYVPGLAGTLVIAAAIFFHALPMSMGW